jgi:tetratricopeptide (TPR) repeat protein
MLKRLLLIVSLLSLPVYSQQDANNRFMLGTSFEQSGEYEKARQIFEELYNGNPANYQYFDALNRVYLQLKDYDNSINIIEDRIKKNEKDINLYGMLGKTYYIKGDENKAFNTWDQALQKTSANQNSYRVMANYAIEMRAFDKAIEYLNKGKSVSDTPRLFSYDLASIYSLTMRFKDAAREYCEIISSNPKQYQLVESRILSYIKKPDALSQTIDVVKNFEGNDKIVIDYLLARLYMEDDKFDKAFDLYLNIDDKQNNEGSDLFSFANFAYSEKHFNLAAKSYNELIKRHPNSSFVSSAKLGYAKTLEEALNIETSDSADSWKPFFKIERVDNDKVEKVINAYNELVNLYPRSEVASEALLRIGRILLYKQNDVSSAEKYFDRIIKEYPRSKFISDTYLELANINVLNNDFDSAKNNLSKVIDNRGNGLDKINLARYNLAKVDFYRGDLPSAKRLLAEILSNLKDNIANDAIELSLLLNTTLNDSSNLVLYAKGELLITQGNYKEASSVFEQIASSKRSFMLANRASLKEAETELALNNYDKSISILQEISGQSEQNLYADQALYLLGNIYQYGMKDDTKALEMYEALLAKFPNSLYLDVAREEIIKIRNKVS